MEKLFGTMVMILIFMCVGCGIEPSGKRPPSAPKEAPKDSPFKGNEKVAYKNDGHALFKGYEAINRTIQARLMAPGERFSLGDYVGESYSPGQNGLVQLMGVYAGSGNHNEFRNGTPNSANMLLWYLALQGFAENMVIRVCDQGQPTDYNKTLVGTLKPFCRGVARTDESQRRALWELIVRYDAPTSELNAWLDYASQQESKSLATVAELITLCMYNPYFLLRQ